MKNIAASAFILCAAFANNAGAAGAVNDALFDAVKARNLTAAQTALSNGAEPDLRTARYAFHLATYSGIYDEGDVLKSRAVFKEVIEIGWFTLSDEEKNQLLLHAIPECDAELTQHLLNAGADPNFDFGQIHFSPRYALTLAASNAAMDNGQWRIDDCTETLDVLLLNGANPALPLSSKTNDSKRLEGAGENILKTRAQILGITAP